MFEVRHLNLPTLRFRRCRGDMIETLNIIRKIYDEETVPNWPRGQKFGPAASASAS